MDTHAHEQTHTGMLQSAHITWHIYTYTHVHQTLSKQTYTHRLSSSNACAHTHTHKKTYTHRPSSSSKVRASKDGGNNPNAIGTLRESVQWGQDEEKDDMPKARGLVRVCVCRCVCVHECACMCAKVCACVHASVHFLCMRACFNNLSLGSSNVHTHTLVALHIFVGALGSKTLLRLAPLQQPFLVQPS